jgi:hypothetical protein
MLIEFCLVTRAQMMMFVLLFIPVCSGGAFLECSCTVFFHSVCREVDVSWGDAVW